MKIRRREFLKKTAAAGMFALAPFALRPSHCSAAESAAMPTRVLGRTGATISVLGYGAMQCSDSSAIRHGLGQGITYVDTADCYMGGRNEKIVGEAIAGIRDKLFIATKVHTGREARMRASVDRSLTSLGVDKVDLMQLHGMSSRHQIEDKDTRNVMEAMKKEGKFRFAGVTTHSNQQRVLEAVMDDGYYDTVLVAVNFRSSSALFETIEKAAAKGIGIIAMKTQNGGYRSETYPELTPHQSALRFAAELPGVHTTIPGMLSKKTVDENLAAIKGKGGLADLLLLDAYRADLEGKACSFCSQCIDQCRYGTGGLDAVRISMYEEGYGDPRLAAERAAQVASAVRTCADCEGCNVECSQGIDIKDSARRAVRFLA